MIGALRKKEKLKKVRSTEEVHTGQEIVENK